MFGSLVFSRMEALFPSKQFMIAISILGAGLATVLAAVSDIFPFFILCTFVQGIFMGTLQLS